ncbi:MAG: hypothetical protein AAF674_14510 [Pseudomonadota bacterium]
MAQWKQVPTLPETAEEQSASWSFAILPTVEELVAMTTAVPLAGWLLPIAVLSLVVVMMIARRRSVRRVDASKMTGDR